MSAPAQRTLDWRRLRTTPLRDLLRGRVTGRLDPAIVAEDAGLPPALCGIVDSTARRTRLFRRERAEVASELAAHFADGLEAGRTPEDLASTFGDPRTAARLIGRAKRRARSFPFKAALGSLKALGATLCVLALVYGALAARYFTTTPGPIVDYLPVLNAVASGLPEHERAWPVYRDILLTSGIREAITRFPYDSRPGWSNWPAIVTVLRENDDALERLRVATQRAGLGFEVGYTISDEDMPLWRHISGHPHSRDGVGGLDGAMLPVLNDLRTLARALALDAIVAATDADESRARRSIEGVLSIASQSRESPALIADLIALSIAELALTVTLEVLRDHPDFFGEESLARLAHAFAAFPRDAQPVMRLDSERLFFLDFVQRVYSLDSRGDGRVAPGGLSRYRWELGALPATDAGDALAGPIFSALITSRREAIDEYDRGLDRVRAWASRPPWERAAFVDHEAEASSGLSRMRHSLVRTLRPTLWYSALHEDSFAMRRDAALAVIAAHLHRARHGEWPDTLESLTPALLPRVPIDMFDGMPLRYTLRDGRPLLYSVGHDATDDSGAVPEGISPDDFAHKVSRWIPRAEVARRINAPGASEPVADRPWLRAEGVYRGDLVLFPPQPAREPPPRDTRSDLLDE